MNFHFTYRTTVRDLWSLSMFHIYGSLVGICNIVFSLAMLALMYVYWGRVALWQQALMLFAFSVFTFQQPLLIYLKSKKAAAAITEDTDLLITDKEIYVRVGERSETLSWQQIKRLASKPGMLILYTDTVHGYLLPNRVLGAQRAPLEKLVRRKLGEG